jgi:hypothetical protein
MGKRAPVVDPSLYDEDLFQWTRETAALIRAGRFKEVDWEHVAEETEDMGKRDRREVLSRLIVLIMHLLKWELQPKLRGTSWRATVVDQRREIELLLADSPSLRRHTKTDLPAVYRKAVRDTAKATFLKEDAFPAECPYSFEQLLDSACWPE